jgi:isoleucyl-tRNA synthetase
VRRASRNNHTHLVSKHHQISLFLFYFCFFLKGEFIMSTSISQLKDSILLPKTAFPMRANLQQKEPEILNFWQSIDLYKALRQQSAGRPKFVLHYGPPYANGAIHTGHVLTECLKDIVNKFKQMEGFDAPLVPGWDCHGLPIEWKIEEGLRAQNRQKEDVPVNEFIDMCRVFANKWIEVQHDGLVRFGICADWEHPYSTMDFQSEGYIVDRFLKIFMEGHVYRGKKPVLWSVVEQTALAEAEVEYKDHVSTAVYVMFPVKSSAIRELCVGEGKAACVIWTTTPWTLPANRAICFNEDLVYSIIVPKRWDADKRVDCSLDGVYQIAKRIDGRSLGACRVPAESQILWDAAQAPSRTSSTAQAEHRSDEPTNFLRSGL